MTGRPAPERAGERGDAAAREAVRRPEAPVVEVLYVAGCPAYSGTLELIERLRAELGVAIDLRTRLIADAAEAELARFPGSPTVRVNGQDVEPARGAAATVTFGCRLDHGGRRAARRIRRGLQLATAASGDEP